ncbi:hypothetical protein V1477_000867 [Vespula maculifrons]|uniref:Uncharacterized protein n=3 Tax=Vespula TaxID=7451 RepID=A0A834NBR1_VESPE|nr:hypothetical protein HZH66_012432 [Vespula vulgaris]KAF7404175.1 hypothetical protein H0235_014869 [Vespula pensylvanica]
MLPKHTGSARESVNAFGIPRAIGTRLREYRRSLTSDDRTDQRFQNTKSDRADRSKDKAIQFVDLTPSVRLSEINIY